MLVREARQLAIDWIIEHEAGRRRFRGAFFSGSTTERSPDSELPPTSDVDVTVVVSSVDAPMKLGKLIHRGVLLEITYLPYRQLADPQTVAHTFFLAHSFRGDQIISDPTGYLRRLQQHVSAHFGEPAEIRLRVENVLAKIVSGVASVDDDAPWQDRVVSWMFPTSLTSVAVLVAAQRNPTVRLRYLNARTALVELGVSEFYVRLLDLLGCTHLGPHQVQRHLDRLAVAFDRAADVARTPFFFSGDVTAFSRPVAIQGSQDLIDAGDHREAVFWIIATYARCLTILDADASDRGAEMAHGFHEAVAELLSVDSSTDLRGRCDDVRRFLPQLRSAAERILTR